MKYRAQFAGSREDRRSARFMMGFENERSARLENTMIWLFVGAILAVTLITAGSVGYAVGWAEGYDMGLNGRGNGL